jgi:hypothetical protein
MAVSTNNFDLPKQGYIAFDAMSLRQLIVNRLNEQDVFKDQNFLGSNLASIVDIVSYSYHTLIYYLNKTATESMFSEAQLYENMNRIVKLIDYSPIGAQTSTLAFNCSAQNLSQGWYTIPRYSYILFNTIPFSFNEDIIFAKTTNITLESLNELAQQKLLFQGIYNEYPLYTANGDPNEMLLLDTSSQIVDHFNIDVYVKSAITNKWKQYSKTSNFYLEDGFAEKFEIRLNGNNRYEIKFGNNINGKQLTKGDQVAIYYLASNGTTGEIGSNAFTANTKLTLYSTIQYNQILLDININNYRYLLQSELSNLIFANSTGSSKFQTREELEEIRQNAPSNYKNQYRLVTTTDYETFAKTNFSYLFSDMKAINNKDYITEYLKYFYDIGLTSPVNTDRALFNQIQYSDSCNFNNIYYIVVPKASTSNSLDYLLPAQKELIRSTVQGTKMATVEISFVDPVYKAITFGVSQNAVINADVFEDSLSNLIITKKSNAARDNNSILLDVVNIFKTYFDRNNIKLGQIFDIRFLTQKILEINDIDSIATANENNNTISVQGLSFFVWNPLYINNDIMVTQNNVSMRYFEYLYFVDIENIANRIRVVSPNQPLLVTE